MINKTAAIIAAAGAGNRLGANLPKALVKLLDKTLVEHAVAYLAPSPNILLLPHLAALKMSLRKY
jgi:2-C-methyl-D-erythritol 4-phosphate cytidylyltransferase/2-C-methyl-D-erythritol 2,4-cyclodiphosphate synthase